MKMYIHIVIHWLTIYKVLPALSEIYETYGNPEVQISNNGPPFNSAQMQKFSASKAIELRNTPQLHPSSNPIATFMRPLSKAMKIWCQNGIPEKQTLKRRLNNYRQTPHLATSIPPTAMFFRDGQRSDFPRRKYNGIRREEITRSRQEKKTRAQRNGLKQLQIQKGI